MMNIALSILTDPAMTTMGVKERLQRHFFIFYLIQKIGIVLDLASQIFRVRGGKGREGSEERRGGRVRKTRIT